MTVTIDSLIVIIDNKIASAYLNVINAVLSSGSEDELRKTLEKCSRDNHIDHYFKWGFGSSHFWVHQRIALKSDQVLKNRVLLARF